MPTCKQCKKFFPLEDNPNKGDCVQRVIDPRQTYYKAKSVDAESDAAKCSEFEKK